MVGEVPVDLRILPKFRFELQLDEFFSGLWASAWDVIAQIDQHQIHRLGLLGRLSGFGLGTLPLCS